MTGCTQNGAGGPLLDARKRVNHSLGMVLGEDEFRQDQLHLRERDHLATRALHGYGTIAGLAVTVSGSELRVAAGLAADPVGRLICVPEDQCVDLDEWLVVARDRVIASLGSPPTFPADLTLYVTLCYRECATDTVPVPVEPCRTGDESMAPSRIAETFALSLAFEPPDVVGEVAGGALAAAVDALGVDASAASPPGGSLPEGSPPADRVEEILAELRAWAVMNRPEVLAKAACLGAPADACLLLGAVTLSIDESGETLVLAGAPEVDDSDRPVVLSTRFLQEWLTRLEAVEAAIPPPPVRVHADLLGLDADDHLRYLPADGSRPLTGDLRGGAFRLTGIGNAIMDDDAVALGQPAGGDLSGTYRNPQVDGLQGRPVSPNPPSAGDVLIFNGAEWVPGQPPPPQERPLFILPFATVTRIGLRLYEIWFNVDAPRNRLAVTRFGEEDLQVHTENPNGPTFLTSIRFTGPRPHPDPPADPRRNVFRLRLIQEPRSGLLRFTFLLGQIQLEGDPAIDVATKLGITFEGRGDLSEDPDAPIPTMTRFLRIPATDDEDPT
jgi:hypothetical protein